MQLNLPKSRAKLTFSLTTTLIQHDKQITLNSYDKLISSSRQRGASTNKLDLPKKICTSKSYYC